MTKQANRYKVMISLYPSEAQPAFKKQSFLLLGPTLFGLRENAEPHWNKARALQDFKRFGGFFFRLAILGSSFRPRKPLLVGPSHYLAAAIDPSAKLVFEAQNGRVSGRLGLGTTALSTNSCRHLSSTPTFLACLGDHPTASMLQSDDQVQIPTH
jgi:hypothetical protein